MKFKYPKPKSHGIFLTILVLCVSVPAFAEDRTPLMSALENTELGEAMAESGFNLNGWIEVAAPFSFNSRRDNLLPRGFDYRANTVNLQQNWVRLERTTDPAAGRVLGFRNDWIAPGIDYRFTLARGVFDEQLRDNNGSPSTYGFDPVQFYAEYQPSPGYVFKLGRFFAPYGMESIEGWSTPLVSRSYNFIYNPFTQTGLLASVPLSSELNLLAAVTAGNDIFIDTAGEPTVDIGLSYTPPEGAQTPGANSGAIFLIAGESRFDRDENFNHPAMLNFVFEHRFTENFRYSLEALAGMVRDLPDTGTAKWFGAAQYLRYQATSTAEAIGRFEVFNDEDGNRTGVEGVYFACTAGLLYRPMSWFQLRPEMRFDHHAQSPAFEGSRDQATLTIDALLRW